MAEVVAFTGMAFADAWRMTWRDYKALNRQWRKWPPAVVSLAVLAKLAPQMREGGPGDDTPDPSLQQQNIEALTSLIGAPPPQG